MQQDARRDVQALQDQWAALDLNPCLPEREQGKSPALPTPVPKADSMVLPGNAVLSFQCNFHFGNATFTLTDYTPDLASHFAPLLSGLPAADTKKSKTRITLFKDADEYVISCNRVELERTCLELVADLAQSGKQ